MSVLAVPSFLLAMGFYQDHLRQLPTGVWYIPSKAQAANPVPITEERDIAIVHIWGPYRFTFQHVDVSGNLAGSAFTQDICPDYVAPGVDFRTGTIFRRLIHTDESGCWSLNPDKHCGWFKRRDLDNQPLYAKGVNNGN